MTKPTRAPAGLTAERVTVTYGGVVAVDNVNLTVLPGEIHGLVGPNGAGKTSFLNAVNGITKASGTVTVGGVDVSRMPASRRVTNGIARSFQHVELADELSVADNIMLGRYGFVRYGVLAAALRAPWVRKAEIADRRVVEEMIEFVELEQWRDTLAGSLPFGVAKRVGLARALVAEPSVLLLDEVGSGLTREEREDLARFILRIQAVRNTAVVWIEHDVSLIRDLADTVTVLNYGKVITSGVPDAVFAAADVRTIFTGLIGEEQ